MIRPLLLAVVSILLSAAPAAAQRVISDSSNSFKITVADGWSGESDSFIESLNDEQGLGVHTGLRFIRAMLKRSMLQTVGYMTFVREDWDIDGATWDSVTREFEAGYTANMKDSNASLGRIRFDEAGRRADIDFIVRTRDGDQYKGLTTAFFGRSWVIYVSFYAHPDEYNKLVAEYRAAMDSFRFTNDAGFEPGMHDLGGGGFSADLGASIGGLGVLAVVVGVLCGILYGIRKAVCG